MCTNKQSGVGPLRWRNRASHTPRRFCHSDPFFVVADSVFCRDRCFCLSDRPFLSRPPPIFVGAVLFLSWAAFFVAMVKHVCRRRALLCESWRRATSLSGLGGADGLSNTIRQGWQNTNPV